METTTCHRCGAQIKNVFWIQDNPYGSECATTILGLKDLPYWYSGGVYEEAKRKFQEITESNQQKFIKTREITSKNWSALKRMSSAYNKARRNDNEWEMSFLESIARQCGLCISMEFYKFSSMEDAENNWQSYMGSFPYLQNEVIGLESLSSKQLQLLERIESK